MRGYGLFYYIAEAFRGLRANRVVNLLAVGTIGMAVLIVGFFLLLFVNLRGPINALSERLEMSVYLREGLTDTERGYLFSRIRSEPGVRSVKYISKSEALELFKKDMKGQEALIEGLGENPLPASYEIVLDQQYVAAGRIEAIASRISALPGVEDVSYGRDGARFLAGLFDVIKYGGAAVAVLLGTAVVFIISNSVRLALYSRGQEIELMQWIGATRGFIQGPFLIEGMLLSVLGASLALGILSGIFYSLPEEAALFVSGPKGLDFLPAEVVAYIIIGSGMLGLVGALISVGRFLE